MVLSTAVSAGLAVAIWRQQQTVAARWFAAALMATAVAALGSALEAAFVPLSAKILASKLGYVGNVAIGPCFFMFSMEHSPPRPAMTTRRHLALWFLPLVTLLLVFTNEWHHLTWPTVTPTAGPQGAAAIYGHGLGVWGVAGYSYLLMAVSTAMLLRTVRHGPALYRQQARPVTLAIGVGILANAAYLAGLSPWPGVDLLPVVLSGCGVLLGWSVFGLRLLDLVPVARGFAVEHLTDAVLTFDQRLRLVDANPAARGLLDRPLAPGTSAAEALAGYPVVLAALTQGVDGRVDQPLSVAGQAVRWIDASLTTLRWLERPVGRVVVMRDVSDARQAEANRHELQRRLADAHHDESLGRLAGGVAHHFNNQLGIVLGHLELAERQLAALPGSDKATTHLARTRAAAERMAALSREMLAYCGGLSVQRTSIQLADLVAATSELLRTNLPRDVTLTLDLAADLPPAAVDANELRKVLGQLITNASEACQGGGQITIHARAVQHDGQPLGAGWENAEAVSAGLYVELAVSDTGAGMGSDVVEHAFEPFYTTKFTGRGLGLAQVLGLVRGHEGAARIVSAPGRGTTVALWLPSGPGPLTP
ncbi:MAG: hypothetical protein HZB16_24585 [Armatimonadetes bacterium]|nr:hypothetical protein [Armatimonadota bacterium]